MDDKDGGAAVDGRAEMGGVGDAEMLLSLGSDRGGMVDADREGPSLEATRACLSKNFLYSYLATNRFEPLCGGRKEASNVTSNVLFKFTVSLVFGKHRWRRVSKFIGIINCIRIDVAHLLHSLCSYGQLKWQRLGTSDVPRLAPLSKSPKSNFS